MYLIAFIIYVNIELVVIEIIATECVKSKNVYIQIGNLYKMVKLAPVEVEAATVTEFASLIENLLTDFY
jgi:hypothetical protein